MEQVRKHYFPANDETVVTGLCPNGEYGAYREDEDEGRIRGYGHSRLSAIADLNSAVSRTDDEYDRRADALEQGWDHARKLRAESV